MLLAEAGRYRDATKMMRRAMQAMPERLVRGARGRALARRLSEYREAAAAEREDPTQ
jgi:hypothetical protein